MASRMIAGCTAMALADMLVVMNAGEVEQIGKPLEIYEAPATTFVATFIGAPPMNLIGLGHDGEVAGVGEGLKQGGLKTRHVQEGLVAHAGPVRTESGLGMHGPR